MKNYQMTDCTYTSYLLAEQGYSIDTIAEIKQRKTDTIVCHLIPYIQQNLFSPIGYNVAKKTYFDFIDYRKNNQDNGLKQMYESFNGEISYDILKFCYYYYQRQRIRIISNAYLTRYFIRNWYVRQEIIKINKELEAIRGFSFKANDAFHGFIGGYNRTHGYNNYFLQESRRLDLSSLIEPRFLFEINDTTYPSFFMATKGYTLKEISLCRNISEETVVEHLIPYIFRGFILPETNLIQDNIYSEIQDYLTYNTDCYSHNRNSYQLEDVIEHFNKTIPCKEIKLGYHYYFRKLISPEEIIQKREYFNLLYRDSYQLKSTKEKIDNLFGDSANRSMRKWRFITEGNDDDYDY